MTWEDPDTLLKMKLGREEYLQRMLTSLILGRSYPQWNTRNPPSPAGLSFLRDLYKQTYGIDLSGPLEFVDEFELLSKNEKDANGAPDYGIFSPSALWIIELKTEAGSHRDGQLPLYTKLAQSSYPEHQVSITYLTGPMSRIEFFEIANAPFRHIYWEEVVDLIKRHWNKSKNKEEQLLSAAVIREIKRLDSPAHAFRKDATIIREALNAAVEVQLTGEQFGVEFETGGLQALHDLRLRIRDALARTKETRDVRPWIWSVATSGGAAMTQLGSNVGYEIRLSRYNRPIK
jgi:hypothetical protein